MLKLKTVGKILLTALQWAVLWGLVGATAGVVATIVEPDTGHIDPKFVPIMIGVPSAAFGALAGLVFASMVVPSNIRFLGPKGRVVIGGVVCAAVGAIFMNVLAHSAIAILLAAFLGAALAARFVKPDSPVEGPEAPIS
ncbi:MAG: hypothetical protein M3P45_03365 [Acidobacteriota bacterium]|nr:hypothetical protein [Acidobacteriota bacterium]